MGRVMSVAAAVVLVLVAGSCGDRPVVDGKSGRPARTERRTQTFEFGAARQGGVIHHTFQVTNPTQETLTVARVQTTCGCTAATVKKGASVAPGGALDVPVDVNLRGKKGQIESKVIVNYDGGGTPDELVLKGSVAEEYTDSVVFQKIKRGEQPEQVVTLATFAGQPPLAVQEIAFDSARFDVTSRPGAQGGTVDIAIRPAAGVPYGSVTDQIVVKTNDAGAPDKRIVARVHVWKPLEAAERMVVLRPETAGGPGSAVVEFKAGYGGPIKDVAVSVAREKRFSAALEPDSPEGTVRVRVTGTAPKNAKKSELTAVLKVTANVAGADAEEQVSVVYARDGGASVSTADTGADSEDHGKR